MKKLLIHIGLVVTIFVIYFLQVNFFSWFTIAGIMPNLFIIFVLFIGLFGNRQMGTVYGVAIGLFLDCLFRSKIGINIFLFGAIGFLATIFDKNFSKDSRMTMMFMIAGATVLFEIASYIIHYIIFSINIEIGQFIRILLMEMIYNVIIMIIIYPFFQKCGYFIENEYKGNRILTRYF